MSGRDKQEGSHPTITEAVERLSSIAEMDFDKGIALAAQDEGVVIPLLDEEEYVLRSVNWLYGQDPESTVEMIKDIFRVILDYLRVFYKKEYRFLPSQQSIEGIKDIMVIVGEAAKKLDQHKEIFKGSKVNSVMDLAEYKKLQDFYLSRIARKIDEGVLSKWILALSKRLLEQQAVVPEKEMAFPPVQHVFVDLESVKKDTEYELFFIRKEDGSRFFSPRLIRNIKLVCDFGDRLGELKQDDPLESISYWRDHVCQASAHDILDAVAPMRMRLYKEAGASPTGELATSLGKALMALLLCSNPHNMAHDPEVKTSTDYFIDFQAFLRDALHTREYNRMLAYPPKDRISHCLLELTEGLCQAFFTSLTGNKAVLSSVQGLLTEALQEHASKHSNGKNSNVCLCDHLDADYAAMSKLFKRHTRGPLVKVLEVLEEGNYHAFDPLCQGNIPNQLYSIEACAKHMENVRIPCPAHQEFINKLSIVDEFKAFLHAWSKDHSHHKFLLINLQDRTSWKEHFRSIALEDLQRHTNLSKHFTVVSLPKDTEFYNQQAPYNQDNHANLFMQHFREHLEDESCGFYFPENIKKALFPEFVDGVMKGVHQLFFGGRNILTRELRQDFIEIFYLFLELKLLELVKPDAFSFMCKDGVDIGPAASAPQFVFLKWMKQEKLSKDEMDQLNLILYASPLLVRERIMLPERFERMQNMLREIELVRNEIGWQQFAAKVKEVFGPYFKSDIL